MKRKMLVGAVVMGACSFIGCASTPPVQVFYRPLTRSTLMSRVDAEIHKRVMFAVKKECSYDPRRLENAPDSDERPRMCMTLDEKSCRLVLLRQMHRVADVINMDIMTQCASARTDCLHGVYVAVRDYPTENYTCIAIDSRDSLPRE